jgi:hypothetical protein
MHSASSMGKGADHGCRAMGAEAEIAANAEVTAIAMMAAIAPIAGDGGVVGSMAANAGDGCF